MFAIALAWIIPFLPAVAGSFLSTKLGQIIFEIIIISIVIFGLWFWFSTHYYNNGWRGAMLAVAAHDQRALKDADDAEKEVKACYASGGTWNQGNLSCDR